MPHRQHIARLIDGWLVPNDAPGFGIDLTRDQLETAVA